MVVALRYSGSIRYCSTCEVVSCTDREIFSHTQVRLVDFLMCT